MRDNTGTRRLLAMQAVSHITEEAARVLPVLTEVYRGGRGSERSEAINAIGNAAAILQFANQSRNRLREQHGGNRTDLINSVYGKGFRYSPPTRN